jgi:predicted GNAT family acetyltransferase
MTVSGATSSNAVRNNTALHRYELDVGGTIAFANYRTAPGAIVITHTETPVQLRGRGIASKLMQGVLEQIRAEGLKIIPGCSFAADYLAKHPQEQDLLADR